MKNTNRFTVTGVLCALILTTTAAGGNLSDTSTVQNQKRHSLEKGKWALLFGVTTHQGVGTHIGGLITIKKMTTDKRALRLGASFSSAISNEDATTDRIRGIDSNWVNTNFETGNSRLTLFFQRLFYVGIATKSSAYFGLGPFMGYSYNYDEVKSTSPAVSRFKRLYDISVGATALAGAEWFATKELSLSAEYSLQLAYRYAETKYWDWRTDTGSYVLDKTKRIATRYSAGEGGVRAGVSIYFDWM